MKSSLSIQIQPIARSSLQLAARPVRRPRGDNRYHAGSGLIDRLLRWLTR